MAYLGNNVNNQHKPVNGFVGGQVMCSTHDSSLEMVMPLSAKYLSAAGSTTRKRASSGTALIFSTTCLHVNTAVKINH